ncbi:MAG TPA: histidine--tRNA ligase [Ardenticatenaceae bacterium]|nr:histidine--tRNA ligase [Ardenticatenaceae bacterium]
MELFQRPTGTQDVLPDDQAYWQWLVKIARGVAARYGYQPFDVPVYEYTELFSRGVGTGTDIVEKEMFSFVPRQDDERDRRQITLRPEFTAGFARAYLQNGMGSWPQPVKLFTIGPLFRYERPQAGRFRQHTQFNCEAIGESDPTVDFEVMAILWDYFTEAGLTGLTFQLNSIGSPEARRRYVREILVPYLRAREHELNEVDRRRLEQNPLRVLDSKEESAQAVIAEAPVITDYLDAESAEHFATLRRYLDLTGRAYVINPRLVRGLDYYSKTVFEIHAEGIGAQSALCGGGRYDGLMELLGGPPTPGVGFGSGIERAIAALRLQGITPPGLPQPPVFGVYFDQVSKDAMIVLLSELRRAGIGASMDYGSKSIKKQMRAGSQSGARFALILGGNELERGEVQVKDLHSETQSPVARDALIGWLRQRLTS